MIDHDPSSEDSLTSLVRNAAPTAFETGFTSRVLARLRAEREQPFSTVFEHRWGARDSADSAIDAALNLPRVSIASAYSASTLLETATTEPEMP
jgi:hypothetical protein